MRLGLQLIRFNYPGGASHLGEEIAAIAKRADEAGFYSFWAGDHFFQNKWVAPVESEMLECYSTLSYAAAVTKNIKLGAMVTGVTFRYPGILVKTATTLDVLSGGRTYFGIGASWNEEEHQGLGVPFPPAKQRLEMLEETLQIALQMWSGSEEPYNGKHFQLARTLNVPQALSKPHPPILIGGQGEKVTLRLVAKYADACNLYAIPDRAAMQHTLDVLGEHCAAVGRNYADIEKTSIAHYKLTRDGNGEREISAAKLVEELHSLAELGIDQHIFSVQNVTDPAIMELIATQVLPEANKIVPAGRTAVSLPHLCRWRRFSD